MSRPARNRSEARPVVHLKLCADCIAGVREHTNDHLFAIATEDLARLGLLISASRGRLTEADRREIAGWQLRFVEAFARAELPELAKHFDESEQEDGAEGSPSGEAGP